MTDINLLIFVFLFAVLDGLEWHGLEFARIRVAQKGMCFI